MASVALRSIITLAAVGSAFALSVPAQAQFYSDGFEFLEAVRDRNGTEATEMLNQPGTTIVNARDITSGETALHIVISRRDLTWTRWLLQEGANANQPDNRGRTPLNAAVEIGFLEGVEALVRRGARVDAASETGETPLMTAVHSRNVELMEVLLEAGADPDRADNAGRSARDYAMLPGTPPRVRMALEANERDAESRESEQVYGPVF